MRIDQFISSWGMTVVKYDMAGMWLGLTVITTELTGALDIPQFVAEYKAWSETNQPDVRTNLRVILDITV